MASAEKESIVKELRLGDLVEEFEYHSRAEIERLRNTHTDFDENVYQQAVELVLRKLGRYEPRNPQ